MAGSEIESGGSRYPSVDDLLAQAAANTELSDFGPGDFREGLDALRDVGKRGVESGRFILKSTEMNALNLVMELHDAQMDLITIKDMDKAVELVKEEFRQRKMRPIVESKT